MTPPRIAIVTGASAGIGDAIARSLAADGHRLVINARRADRLDALAAELNDAAGTDICVPVPGDAADPDVIGLLLDTARTRHGGPRSPGRDADLVVVNAGRGLAGSVTSSDESQWDELVRTNLLGAARLMRAAAARMLDDGPETTDPAWTNARPRDIVVLGSTVGRHVSPFSSFYGGSKFAVHSYAEALRRELGPRGIRVSLIEPGIVRSEFQAVAGYDEQAFGDLMERFSPVLRPQDIADLIRFIVGRPPGVHINDAVIRATRQDYP